jgi:hypothetical protein
MSTHTTTTNPIHPTAIRRLAVLALGLLIALTGIGLGSAPAGAIAPGSPKSITTAGYGGFVRVYWSTPIWEDSEQPVTGYQVMRMVDGQADKFFFQETTAPLVDHTTVPGTTYTYSVRASTDDGYGDWSDDSNVKEIVGKKEWQEFATTAHFVNRQYQDILGRQPTPVERGNAVANLDQGAWSAGTFTNLLLFQPSRTPRHQVIRLYNAYFDRTADHAGLDYWFDQITKKGKSINTVSSSFAASAEFKDMYGNLTNGQFVNLVYENVLDRFPSPSDKAYWTGQLDQGVINRGRLMTLFSESAEYKGLSRGIVQAADVYDAMLGVTPSAFEIDIWGSHIQDGGNPGDYGTRLMLLADYDA